MSDFIQKQFAGRKVKSEILVGQPFSEICRYAAGQACDLIVIGSHARGIVHRIFMGSVSKAVLEHASCPVLMVPLAAV
ncbi:MAG: universal stress protein [Planctomycetes bacterium]|nr:universal stress protein [Planctomycetota bacterium]